MISMKNNIGDKRHLWDPTLVRKDSTKHNLELLIQKDIHQPQGWKEQFKNVKFKFKKINDEFEKLDFNFKLFKNEMAI